MSTKKSLRYQRGNQNPYIEEEQTTQRPKEKVQKDKQRSTKHTPTAHTYKLNKIPPNPSEGLFVLLLSIRLIGTLCEMHLFYLGKLLNQGYK
jgi:hypothetical protein